jgi:metal-responsive CopG/Arc/MetJ family transcriptional regulator
MSARAHIVLPEELLERVDRVAGKRRRSRFVEEAVREKLARQALAASLEAGAGILDRADYPEWSSPENTSRWVSALREADRRLPENES